jgi:hypothetical protein
VHERCLPNQTRENVANRCTAPKNQNQRNLACQHDLNDAEKQNDDEFVHSTLVPLRHENKKYYYHQCRRKTHKTDYQNRKY